MWPRTGARDDGGPTLWRRSLWPLLGGTVTAVGVFGASRAYGMVGLLMATVLLSPFAVVMAWGLSEELGFRRSKAVPIGLGSTLVVLVLLGLSHLFGGVGLLVAVVTALSSPTVLGLVGRLRRRGGRRQNRAPVPGVLLDPIMLDRRFKDIVRRLDESG
jgi:hypothetical protein